MRAATCFLWASTVLTFGCRSSGSTAPEEADASSAAVAPESEDSDAGDEQASAEPSPEQPDAAAPDVTVADAAPADAAPVDAAPQDAANEAASPELLAMRKQELGRRIFEDVRLSEPAGLACASCHEASAAFTGNHGSKIAAVALGSRSDQFGNRSAPTAMYASYSPAFGFIEKGEDDPEEGEMLSTVAVGGQFWDGRASDLREQAKGPLLNPREMNNPDKASVVEKLRAAPYVDVWNEVFGASSLDDVERAYGLIAEAIAAFEETERFHPFSSKFDAVLRGKAQFSAAEQRGFDLFKKRDKGNCIACHAGDPNSSKPEDWLFTDFTFDNLGIPRNPEIPDNMDPSYFDLGLCSQPALETKLPPNVSKDSLCGAFKVPTLRNVASTAPYGHNGFFKTLRDVVRFYATRETNPEDWYPAAADGGVQKYDDLPAQYHDNVNHTEVPYDRKSGEAPRLNDAEIDDIVAFLQTLTDAR